MEEEETATSSPESSEADGAERANLITSASVGRRVIFFSSQGKERYGTLRYYGRPEFSEGVWCGVELDKPEGKNNGSKHGIRYFTCEPAYGAFVPAGKVELDTTRRSRSRPNSRPGSRPNSRPSSAERGKAARSDASSATGVRPTAVQHELARLAQPPVTERLTKRKAAQSSVTNWRQPLKAFAAQSKDDASVSKRGAKVPAVAFRTGGSGGMHRAASSENLRGLKELSDQNKSVKKSSSERNLREGNTLPRMAGKSSSKRSRPSVQNVFPSEKEAGAQAWPRVSTPKNGENDGSEAVDGTVSSSHSSDSSSRAPSPQSCANNGFVATPDMPLNSGLATHASQLAESEKHSVGLCQVPSPEAGRSKQCYQNSTSGAVTLAHPLSQAAGQPDGHATPQAVLQLLTQLVQQNQDLRKRQDVLEQKLEVSVGQWQTAMGALQQRLEKMQATHQSEVARLQGLHQTELQALTAQHQQDLVLLHKAHNHARPPTDQAKLVNSHAVI